MAVALIVLAFITEARNAGEHLGLLALGKFVPLHRF